VRAAAYSHDDQEALALLFLPFLLVASAIGISQSVRHIAMPEIAGLGERLVAVAPAVPRTVPAGPARLAARELPVHVGRPVQLDALVAPVRSAAIAVVPPARDVPQRIARELAPPRPAELPAAAPSELALARPAAGEIEVREGELAGLEAPLPASEPITKGNVCVAADAEARPVTGASPAGPEEFGRRLAAAAHAQLDDFVIYNDSYRSISYPMGDVPALFGVCTDLVVRAYRAVGLDLQALVHQARVGSGDTNIDHRRTETLRRFFAANGQSLPVSEFAEDYQPGDIVTYYRPQNRRSTSHIAIVADAIAPSGRPMIIHNRGWGPQMEDGLFVDEMTGHYRYSGPQRPRDAPKANFAEIEQSKRTPIPRSVRAVIRASFAPRPSPGTAAARERTD